MLQNLDVSQRSVGTNVSGEPFDDIATAVAAVDDKTEIQATLECTKRGVHRELSDGSPSSLGDSHTVTVVTGRAVHVLPDGTETGVDDICTVPFTQVESAASRGLVRRKLVVRTDSATYRIQPDGRPDLSDITRFINRGSRSWDHVEPWLRTAREAITSIEEQDDDADIDDSVVDEAEMALSKVRSDVDELAAAVDAIEHEVERLQTRLNDQLVRRHVHHGEARAQVAKRKREFGLLPAAQAAYEDARDHYRTALDIALANNYSCQNQIKARLEATREALYDIEVNPALEGYEAVERARDADDLDTSRDEWQRARELFQEARDQRNGEQLADRFEFALAWVDGALVRACQSYAEELESQADDHVADGHEQWGYQLYVASAGVLSNTLDIARQRDGCPTEQIERDLARITDRYGPDGLERDESETASD